MWFLAWALQNTIDSKSPVKNLFSFKLSKGLSLLSDTKYPCEGIVYKQLVSACLSFFFTPPATVDVWSGIWAAAQNLPPKQSRLLKQDSNSLHALLWMKERDLCEPSFWRGEGLHVLPKLSHHTAGECQGRAAEQCSLLCRDPLVHLSNSLVSNLKWPKWRKGEKDQKKTWENKLNRRRYITLSRVPIWLNEMGFPQKSLFFDESNINKLTRSEISERLFLRSAAFFFSPLLSTGGNRLTGHRTGSENCRQLLLLCLLRYSLMASFNMHFSPNSPAGDTQ